MRIHRSRILPRYSIGLELSELVIEIWSYPDTMFPQLVIIQVFSQLCEENNLSHISTPKIHHLEFSSLLCYNCVGLE